MKHRVMVDLSFDTKADADEFIVSVQNAKAKASDVIKPVANYHECRHDEGKPCSPKQDI